MAAFWMQPANTARAASSVLRRHRRRPTAMLISSMTATTTTTTTTPLRCLHASAPPRPRILQVSEEVDAALATNQPVVALESTIYTHGALGVDLRLEAIVRAHGAVPAVIGVLDGRPTVGLTPVEVTRMVDEGAEKVSRRDLARMVAGVGKDQHHHGGTTISGTMILARQAGIRVFGTGGLGGVHRGWHDHMDVSADLSELGRTRVAVVSSGCKGFLDIAASLEYLETQGVYVGTFADDGRAAVPFPAFWARESGVPSPAVVHDEAEAAAIVWAQEQLGIETGLLFANPIPATAEVPRAEMEAIVAQAVDEAAVQGYTGNRNTPFVLRRIRELTDSRSVDANIALVQANVARAAKMAVHLSVLVAGKGESTYTSYPIIGAGRETTVTLEASRKENKTTPLPPTPPRADILVAGSLALDLSCDYVGSTFTDTNPILYTSNPAAIVPSVGGVGHNVALAAHLISPATSVQLCSIVGDDVAGASILASVQASGLGTAYVHRLDGARGGVAGSGEEEHDARAARTAHYVSVNDADNCLVMAMADMAIFARDEAHSRAAAVVAAAQPRWLVVDGNWSAAGVREWIRAGRQQGAQVAFEPVSVAKSARLFEGAAAAAQAGAAPGIFPTPLVDLATPNQLELEAMHAAAASNGCLVDDARWFRVVDALGLAGMRDRFVRLTSAALTDDGVPVQCVQLLPYIPTLITKLGGAGALLTMLLRRDDPLLYDAAAAPYLLARAPPPQAELARDLYGDGAAATETAVGGVYMRLFPAAELVPGNEVVSVNGLGDTFLGALVAGLAQGGQTHQLMDVAQQAAVLTLRTHESVSRQLDTLADALTSAVGKAS